MSISRMDTLGPRGKSWEDQRRFVTLRELPKSAFFSKTAVAAMPNGRGRTVIYSHGEVYKMVETVASAMRESGVRPGTVCATLAPNSFEMVVYFLAVQWIGAVAAPIDPTLRKDEIVMALRAAKASIVASPLVDEDERDEDDLWSKVEAAAKELNLISWHLYRTINTGVQIEMHGVRANESAAWNGGSADYKVDPDEVAVHLLAVNTAPLAVLPLTHRNLAEAAKSFAETYDLVPGQATVLSSSLSTIQGVLTLISAFLSGGLVVLSGDGAFDVTDFWNVAALYEVSWLSADVDDVVALHTETAAQIENGSNKHNDVQLAFVRCTGGVLAPELVTAMTETLRTPVLCSYGPAEASGMTTTNLVTSRRGQSFGKTAKNCAIAVFDPDTRLPVEADAVGDVGVAGDNVAVGFLDSGEANASYLVEDASGGEPTTYFLTGDRGHVDADGFLFVSGDSREMRAAELVAIQAEQARKEEAERIALEEEVRRSGEAYASSSMARQLTESEGGSTSASGEESTSEEASDSSDVVDDESDEEEEEEEEEEKEDGQTSGDEADKDAGTAEASDDDSHAKEASAAAAAAAAAATAAAVAHNHRGNTSDGEDTAVRGDDAEEGSRGLARRWDNASRDAEETASRAAPVAAVRSGLDKTASDAILARMAEIEAGQKRLERELAARHDQELAELEARLEAAEVDAAAAAEEQRRAVEQARSLPATNTMLMTPQLLSINMDGIDAAVTAAAASAEESAASTAEAFKAAEAAKKAAEASERASQSSQQAIRAIPPPMPPPAVIVEEVPETGTVSRDVSVAAFDAQSVTKVIKVSLDEVEAVMRQHPAVAAVRAFGKSDSRYGYDVYCAIVAKKGARLSEAWLKLHAQSMLPATMVPRKFFACSLPSLGAADRVSLATERALQEMNPTAGLSQVKQIKAPQWKPSTATRPATAAQ